MRILLLAPSQREYRYMKAALDRASSLRNSYTLVHCGIGKAAAAASTAAAVCASAEPFDLIAVAGYAASTSGRRRGDVVVPRTARYHDCTIPEGFIPELTDPYTLCGTDPDVVFTGDSFVDAEIIADIKRRFGCDSALFDMEITAVCQAAEMSGRIPVVAVKMISDIPEQMDTAQSYDEFADSHTDFSIFVEKLEELSGQILRMKNAQQANN